MHRSAPYPLLAVLALCAGVAQGSIYSQYTLDGPAATDTYGLTSSGKDIALGSGADAVCGQSYHMLAGDFINLAASNGAPTGNVDFSIAGHVKPVTFGGRALFAIGATFKDTDGSAGNWGAWVWVDATGQVGFRTLVLRRISTTALRTGEWAHVMLTYTAAEGMLRLWVDGVVVLMESVTMTLRQNSRYGGMAIGEYHLGGSPWGRGGEFFVDHVSFANHAFANMDEAVAPCTKTVSPPTNTPATPVPSTPLPPTPLPATPVPSTPVPTPVPTSGPAPSPTAKVFLMAGQSNMVGHANAADIAVPAELSVTRTDVFAKSIIEVNRATGPLQPLYGKSFGPELGFGHVLGDTFAEDVYLFKAAKGGTQIARADHWAPDGDADNLYNQAIAGFKQFLADDVPADHVVSGFVWFQGYNDAFSDADANGYEAALVKLIASVRQDLGVADLPVVVVQGNDNQGVRGDTIRAAQAKVATEDAHADWVVSDDLYHYFHYDSTSQATIGRRAGDAMLPLLGRPGAFNDVYVATQGVALDTPAPGVLANDRGVANGVANVVSQPAHGLLGLNADGSFTYNPTAGYVGMDTFTYAVTNTLSGAVGNPAVVEIWVQTSTGAADDLIVHYSFDEAGVTVDSSSHPAVFDSAKKMPAHADPTGVSVGETDGVSGKCAVLSGTSGKWNDGHVKVMRGPMPDFLLFGLDDITVCMWVKVTVPTTDKMPIFSNAGRPNTPGLTLLTAGTGKSFTTVVYGRDGNKITVAAGGPAIDDGEWHHVAAVVSRSTNTATNYVDGQAVSTAGISAVAGVFEEGYYTRFGGVAWLGSNPKFVGHMDEARVYRAALTPARISQLFAGRQ